MSDKKESGVQHALAINEKKGDHSGRFKLSNLLLGRLGSTRYVVSEGESIPHLETPFQDPIRAEYSPLAELSWTGLIFLESDPKILIIQQGERESPAYALLGSGTIALSKQLFVLDDLESCGGHFHVNLSEGELRILAGILKDLTPVAATEGYSHLNMIDTVSLPVSQGAAVVGFDVRILKPVSEAVYLKLAEAKTLELRAAGDYLESLIRENSRNLH